VPRGLFLAFEGIDGSGKSTQARRAAENRGAHLTFEPGDSDLGADLRRWLLDAAAPMSATTEALLMLADRAHHVATVIEPLLVAGTDVVTDRFSASTLAYQGYGRGLDLEMLRRATDLAVGSTRPDLTILLDLPVEAARARRAARASDRFDAAGPDFLDRVRRGFLELVAADERAVVVDASGSPADVARDVDRWVSRSEDARRG
jgi:dTMP kinase